MNGLTIVVGDSICGSASTSKFVLAEDEVFLRGHNTYEGDRPTIATNGDKGGGEIIAAINGLIEVTDRVVSVKGMYSRYHPEIGDIVVGRVKEVTGNRWRLEIGAHQDAVMLLSNVTEPGGILRRRGRSDELTMRHIFDQDDLIVAEVQRISPEGIVFLHTRSGEKYGKLSTPGVLVFVTPALVKRAKHQFISVDELSVSIVIGINGIILVCAAITQQNDEDVSSFLHVNSEFSSTEVRRGIARVANCIKVLDRARLPVFSQSINSAVKVSLEVGLSPFEILHASHQDFIATSVMEAISSRKRLRA